MWTVVPTLVGSLAKEACGSPQLVQRICLDLSFRRGIKEGQNAAQDLSLDEDELRDILVQSASYSDFKTMVTTSTKVRRRRDRRPHKLIDGSTGDVYRVLLLAMAGGLPTMELPYWP